LPVGLLRPLRAVRRRLTRRSGRSRRRGPLILLYHCIDEVFPDPFSLCVTPEHFAQHLQILRHQAFPISLRDLAALGRGEAPRRAVVVTFDDGYADNLSVAKPLLEKFDVPATFFVATGYVDGVGEFWWDLLERILLQPGTLPERLRLTIDGRPREWDLGAGQTYSEEDFVRWRTWTVAHAADPTPRHPLYRSLWQSLLPLNAAARQAVVEALRAWAGAPHQGRPNHRALTAPQLDALAAAALMEVGGHTVSHPLLAALPFDDQRAEIKGCKKWLEDRLGRPIESFAYPFGWRSAYTPETMRLVREAGFTRACAASAWVSGRLLELPRVVAGDWDGDEFARRLEDLLQPD
jgi:peptidoglycan/xylan/chitin deacetylase (PgdA/CDA1 family)